MAGLFITIIIILVGVIIFGKIIKKRKNSDTYLIDNQTEEEETCHAKNSCPTIWRSTTDGFTVRLTYIYTSICVHKLYSIVYICTYISNSLFKDYITYLHVYMDPISSCNNTYVHE